MESYDKTVYEILQSSKDASFSPVVYVKNMTTSSKGLSLTNIMFIMDDKKAA
ncbi:hypothetical protein P0F39_002944 [Vibrio metschnikovii]|uniref:hypothetical protein n=1 Tax=Vibrio metschnikovii TaxID=28172 RepID=UPI0016456DAF|nr:hypothetical protein [Vibrio metschnikovii]EKO3781369.1 hypothetical protein [Vibrio metschnikovii]EKO3886312.1 hypothetical protein [Vibrio metschnikovii]EKO3934869.1 hypothetical protein [Vibrio metschnikovii]MBC3620584.1 hypothetical protein [Vibrio metschnikovii]MBC5832339.1 hypothetical protein [Vibrio metschnikovii]